MSAGEHRGSVGNLADRWWRMSILPALCAWLLLGGTARAGELEDLVVLAFSNSPALRASREGTAQAAAAFDATAGFRDPVATAAAGWLSGTAATPLLAAPAGLPSADAYGAAAAVEVPLQPGLYAGVGASEQYQANPSDGSASGYRTLVGAQLRIPLRQDRGFSLWKQEQSRQRELLAAAEARLLETQQSVRHAVEQSYFSYLGELANADTAESAAARARELLREAEELVKLKMVPEYQLAPARLELALRREEQVSARQATDTARLRLWQVLGTEAPALLTTNADTLVNRASGITIPDIPAAPPFFERRGAMQEIESLAAAAAAETRRLEDQLRSQLALSLRGVWAANENADPAGGSWVSGEDSSAAAVLVWTRPWDQTGPRARLREARAREAQLAELRQDLQNRLAADLAAARRDVAGFQDRFQEITVAVDQARRTLEAEAERFRLGEGRSRNVLDAQNDLTKACRTRIAIVASLLKGYSDVNYALGYGHTGTGSTGAVTSGGHAYAYP